MQIKLFMVKKHRSVGAGSVVFKTDLTQLVHPYGIGFEFMKR